MLPLLGKLIDSPASLSLEDKQSLVNLLDVGTEKFIQDQKNLAIMAGATKTEDDKQRFRAEIQRAANIKMNIAEAKSFLNLVEKESPETLQSFKNLINRLNEYNNIPI